MSRLIDEAELKDWVENWFYQNKYYHPYSKSNSIPCSELYDIFERMPTVDAVELVRGKWIPCSERLPNGQTEVIVSCCDDAGDSKYNYTSFGWMTRDGEYWIVDNEINYYVNAWMPLPEPWKGAER